jgi:hypothetical protein
MSGSVTTLPSLSAPDRPAVGGTDTDNVVLYAVGARNVLFPVAIKPMSINDLDWSKGSEIILVLQCVEFSFNFGPIRSEGIGRNYFRMVLDKNALSVLRIVVRPCANICWRLGNVDSNQLGNRLQVAHEFTQDDEI